MGTGRELGQLHRVGPRIQQQIPGSGEQAQEDTAKEVREGKLFPNGFLMLPQGKNAKPKEEDSLIFSSQGRLGH
jgi:hypothetical protein